MGFENTPLSVNSGVGQPLNEFKLDGRMFTLTLYRCPICGYLELFDDDVHHEH